MTGTATRAAALAAALFFAAVSAAAAQSTHEHQPAPQKPTEKKEYPAGVAPITDEDRKAAFPELDQQGHTVHDGALHSFVKSFTVTGSGAATDSSIVRRTRRTVVGSNRSSFA